MDEGDADKAGEGFIAKDWVAFFGYEERCLDSVDFMLFKPMQFVLYRYANFLAVIEAEICFSAKVSIMMRDRAENGIGTLEFKCFRIDIHFSFSFCDGAYENCDSKFG